MTQLSEDDGDLAGLTDQELARAWDLWFDLAQTTNDDDPPYTHGVFQLAPVTPSVTSAHHAGDGSPLIATPPTEGR